MCSSVNSSRVTSDMEAPEFARTGCVEDLYGDRMIWQFPVNLVGVSMELKNRELWQKFNAIETEMIITKPGRRMFPYIEVRLDGLDPEENYAIALELRQSSEHRYRFQANKWVEAGRANPPNNTINNMFVFSPKKGKEWMQELCSTYFVKITNCNDRIKHKGEDERPLLLASMQKYIPVLHVIKTDSKFSLTERPKTSFIFPEAEFIAVTAYQNVAVKDLKVQYNPFAKAFRLGASSNRKRRSCQTLETERNRLMSDGGSSSNTSSVSPCSIPTASSISPHSVPSTSASPLSVPSTSSISPRSVSSTSSISPHSVPSTSLASPSTSLASPSSVPSTSLASPSSVPSTSLASPSSVPSTSLASPSSVPSTSLASPSSVPSTSLASPSSVPSTSSTSPHYSTSSTAVESKVVDVIQNYESITNIPSHTFFPIVNQSTSYPAYCEQATKLVEMMNQYLLVRPWEVPPVTMCTSNPYGFNIPLPMPVYWNPIGYPLKLPLPPFYPPLPPPPAYTFENELMDLSMRAHVKDETEENPI